MSASENAPVAGEKGVDTGPHSLTDEHAIATARNAIKRCL